MTAPAVSTDHAAAPSATPLEQDIGQMFGDYSTSAEPPEPEDSAAGTTPAEPSEGTAPGVEGEPEPKEGAAAVEPQSEGTTPAATTEVVEDDPWKDTAPASFVVNGKTLTSEDIRVFKEGGAAIRPESLPNVLSRLAERETLAERVQTSDRNYQTLAKATEWTDSTGKTLTGPEAAIEMRVGAMKVLSENQLIVNEVIKCPDLHAAGFLTTETRPDGKGGTYEAVVFRPDAIARLQRENDLTQREVSNTVRDHYKTVVAEAQAAPAAIDFPAASKSFVTELAKASNLDASVLTPADHAAFAKHLPFHAKDGKISIEWQEMVKDRITDRAAQKVNAAQIATTTEKATKDGAVRLLAAARGVKPGQPAKPAVAPKAPTPQSERAQSEGEMFDSMLNSGAAAMRSLR